MFRVFLNIGFTSIGILYFSFYYLLNYELSVEKYFAKFDWGTQGLSIFNGTVGFLFIIGVFGLLTKIFEYFFNKYFPNNMFLNLILKIINLTKYFIALNLFIYFAIVPQWIHALLIKIYYIGILLVVIISVTSLINNIFTYKLLKTPKIKSEGKTLLPFINKIIVIVIWVIGAITIFDNLGYNITAFVAGAGIGGLAIAFAAQKSISNIFGALTILFNKPFKVGDTVKINGVNGVVKAIGLMYITITENNGHTVLVPNETTISSNIENFSTRSRRKTEFILKIDSNTSTLKVQKGVDAIEAILQKYVDTGTISSYRVTFDTFGDYSLNINVFYNSLLNSSYGEYSKQKEEINYEIKKSFDKLKIELANAKQDMMMQLISQMQAQK